MAQGHRRGRVHCNGRLAGVIEETPGGYRFAYDAAYLEDPESAAVSLTLPKRRSPFESTRLFAFFHGLLAEGSTKDLQCRLLRIDESDHFGRLLKTAHSDVIGAVTVLEAEEETGRGP